MSYDKDAARATRSTPRKRERPVIELWTDEELEWVPLYDGSRSVDLIIHERPTGRGWKLFRVRMGLRPYVQSESATSPQDVDMPVGP